MPADMKVITVTVTMATKSKTMLSAEIHKKEKITAEISLISPLFLLENNNVCCFLDLPAEEKRPQWLIDVPNAFRMILYNYNNNNNNTFSVSKLNKPGLKTPLMIKYKSWVCDQNTVWNLLRMNFTHDSAVCLLALRMCLMQIRNWCNHSPNLYGMQFPENNFPMIKC